MSATEHMTPSQARTLAVQLLQKHGLSDWSFKFDRAIKRAGLCSHRTRTISLSSSLLAARSYEASRMTILHEVAHALAGSGHGHDRVWKAIFHSMGGDGQRCYDTSTIIAPEKIKAAPYQAHCPTHGVIANYFRAPRGTGHACRKCRQTVTWTKDGRSFSNAVTVRRVTVTTGQVRAWA